MFLYEVYDNEAALTTHRATDHFKKFAAATADMVAKREVRAMTPIAFNATGTLIRPGSPCSGGPALQNRLLGEERLGAPRDRVPAAQISCSGPRLGVADHALDGGNAAAEPRSTRRPVRGRR